MRNSNFYRVFDRKNPFYCISDAINAKMIISTFNCEENLLEYNIMDNPYKILVG